MSRRKKVIILVVVVLAVGEFVGWKIISGKSQGYIFGTVQKRTITEMVSESGTVSSNGRVVVYSPANGVVEKVYVINGEKVTEKQKLLTVKSTATPQEKAAAWASYQSAVTAVQQAENNRRLTLATVDRVHDDVKNNDKDETFLEKETRTTAEVANDNAYDTLLSARAQLTSAQTAYQATQNATVTAPIAGLISNLGIVPGGSVLVNNVLVPGVPALIISGVGATEVMMAVGEGDVNKIKTGQEADIKLDAVADKVFKGVVRRVDDTGTLISGVVKFRVYIEIPVADGRLKPGMTADADIVTNELANVLSVPNTAVKPYQKGRAVRVAGKNGQMEYVPVKIGVKGKEFTQITEGLSEGQKIIETLASEKTDKKGFFGM